MMGAIIFASALTLPYISSKVASGSFSDPYFLFLIFGLGIGYILIRLCLRKFESALQTVSTRVRSASDNSFAVA